jgi:mannose/cellobiose epimerase-like protein (N-acyl-D-glucosamine 2-epimerase family)
MTTVHNATLSPLRGWLLHEVCPFWFERLLDPAGGFYEALDENSQAVESIERTVLNQARLTYTASHAWLLARDERMLRAANHGFAVLKKACAPAGPAGGWPRKFCTDGTVVDATRDAYDHAFVIFGLAWYYRATGNLEALEMAGQAYAFMQARLADKLHGGFFEEYPQTDKLPRRQNPHMHLLEAVLAVHAATGDAQWLAEAKRLTTLFEAHFFDAEGGSLAEYFQADWTAENGSAGALREPGHQFEWVWLLGEYARQSGDGRYAPLAGRLYAFGAQFGIDRQGELDGVVMDGVNPKGDIVAATKLLWPQTEYIKACVSKFETTGEAHYLATAQTHVGLLRQHFFRADGMNWCNQLSRRGEMLPGVTPSRVLYHLFLALAEVIRVEEPA